MSYTCTASYKRGKSLWHGSERAVLTICGAQLLWHCCLCCLCYTTIAIRARNMLMYMHM